MKPQSHNIPFSPFPLIEMLEQENELDMEALLGRPLFKDEYEDDLNSFLAATEKEVF